MQILTIVKHEGNGICRRCQTNAPVCTVQKLRNIIRYASNAQVIVIQYTPNNYTQINSKHWYIIRRSIFLYFLPLDKHFKTNGHTHILLPSNIILILFFSIRKYNKFTIHTTHHFYYYQTTYFTTYRITSFLQNIILRPRDNYVAAAR